jgi:hypothetical protein
MIKKNLVLTVTEVQPSGEEILYTIKSVVDRKTFLFEAGTSSILISDTKELYEAIGLVQQFGKDNPSESEVKNSLSGRAKEIERLLITPFEIKTNVDPLAIAGLDDIPVVENIVKFGENLDE